MCSLRRKKKRLTCRCCPESGILGKYIPVYDVEMSASQCPKGEEFPQWAMVDLAVAGKAHSGRCNSSLEFCVVPQMGMCLSRLELLKSSRSVGLSAPSSSLICGSDPDKELRGQSTPGQAGL